MQFTSKKFTKFQANLAVSLRTQYRKVGGLPMAVQKKSFWQQRQTPLEFVLIVWLEWITGLYLLLRLLPQEASPAVLLEKQQPASVAVAALLLIFGLPLLAFILNFFTPVLQLVGGFRAGALWLCAGLALSAFLVSNGRRWLKEN